MKNILRYIFIRRSLSCLKTFLFAGITLALLSGKPGDTGDPVIIINIENTTSTLTKSQVKLIYLRTINRRWKGLNKNIAPVDRAGLPEIKSKFLASYLEMTADEMNRYFTEREYQNAEMPPVTLNSDKEVLEFVENNIGAIGYVDSNSLIGVDISKIRIIQISSN